MAIIRRVWVRTNRRYVAQVGELFVGVVSPGCAKRITRDSVHAIQRNGYFMSSQEEVEAQGGRPLSFAEQAAIQTDTPIWWLKSIY